MSIIDDLFHVIDTPGAYVRGALSGKFGERASGEDVLRHLLGGNPNKWAGIAAEMVLDPINLIPGGMGLKALRGAKKATQANKATRIMIKKGAMPADVAAKTVVGKGGKPTALFHGSQFPFEKFDPKRADTRALYGPGYYHTEDAAIASQYAEAKGINLRYADELASPEEFAKFYAPGRKLRHTSSNPNNPLRKDSEVWGTVVSNDPKTHNVVIYDPLTKRNRTINATYLRKGDYAREFETRAPHVRKSYMDSRKAFDLDADVSAEDLGGILAELEEKGFPDAAYEVSGKWSQALEEAGYPQIGIPGGPGSYGPSPLTGEQLWKDMVNATADDMFETLFPGTKILDAADMGEVVDHATTLVNSVFQSHGFDSLKHMGGKITGGAEHAVHIGLMGESQMYLPHVAPAIQRVPKPRIGLLAAGAGAYQAGTKIGLRPREEQRIGLRR